MTLSVVGAGLGRTGADLLKVALEKLGFGNHHISEVFGSPEQIARWAKAADGAPDGDAIFKGYGSAVDFPTAGFWRQVAAQFSEGVESDALAALNEHIKSTVHGGH